MLFERAQANTGLVSRAAGGLFHDSRMVHPLIAIQPWRSWPSKEKNCGATRLTSGLHNLAVLEVDRVIWRRRKKGFLASAPPWKNARRQSTDIPLRYRLADIASWLGRVAEATAATPKRSIIPAKCRPGSRTDRAASPWTRAGNSFRHSRFYCHTLTVLGRRPEAVDLLTKAQAAYAALVEQDPKNQQRQLALLAPSFGRHWMFWWKTTHRLAAPIIKETRTKLEALVAAEPAARVFTGRLLTAWMLEARLHRTTAPTEALTAAEHAITFGELLLKEDRADAWVLWDWAQARLLAGRIEEARGQTDALVASGNG